MPKSAKSVISWQQAKRKNNATTTPPGRRPIASLKDLASRREPDLPSYTVRVPDQVDVAKLRHSLGLSQNAFARAFGLDVTAIHAWEQGRRRPDRTARILLAVIAKEPDAVRRALTRRGMNSARLARSGSPATTRATAPVIRNGRNPL